MSNYEQAKRDALVFTQTLIEVVDNLEEKLSQARSDRFTIEVKLGTAEYDLGKLKAERDELAQRIEQVEAERDYRAEENKELYEKLKQVLAVPVVPVKDFSIPRVIATEELREGQWFAYKDDESETWHTLEAGDEDFMLGFMAPGQPHTIVLLADAPEPKSEVTAETIRASEPGSTWEDREGDIWEWDGDRLRWHRIGGGLPTSITVEEGLEIWGPLTHSSVPPRGDYPKRLTVEDLDAAEVGSVLETGDTAWVQMTKRQDGRWEDPMSNAPLLVLNADQLMDIDKRYLTPPEKPERPRPQDSPILIKDAAFKGGKSDAIAFWEEADVWGMYALDPLTDRVRRVVAEGICRWSRIVVEGGA